jgi:hypothetical protein
MEGMSDGFGVITQPGAWGVAAGIKEGRFWALDNAAFSNGFDPGRYYGLLEKLEPHKDTCLFVVMPDVVGDAKATLEEYERWPRPDFPVAFVAQDGQEDLEFPDFDWLFVGGTTDWKMGQDAIRCIERAHDLGKPVHVGRVNSIKRFQYFQKLGVFSVDGTKAVFAPDYAKRLFTRAVSQLSLCGLVPGCDSVS